MPRHKSTLIFQSAATSPETAGSTAGWSESWYDPDDVSDEAAELKTFALVLARKALLASGWSIQAIRISRLDANANLLRRGRLVFIPPDNGQGTYLVSISSEQPYDALVVGVASVVGYKRGFSMRGLGVGVVSGGARYLEPPAFLNAFTLWREYLTGTVHGQPAFTPWAIRFRTIITVPEFPLGAMPITNVIIGADATTPGSPQSPVIRIPAIADAMNFHVGDQFVIQGVLGMTGINGTWKVIQVYGGVSSGFRLAPKRRVQVGGVFTTSGNCRVFRLALDNIQQATPGYGSSRQTGRPLVLGRGRRSARVC